MPSGRGAVVFAAGIALWLAARVAGSPILHMVAVGLVVIDVTGADGRLERAASSMAHLPLGGLDGYGLILEHPEAKIARFAEEHGFLDLGRSNTRPNVGDVVRIVPNHVCVVVNMFDEVVMVRGDEIIGTLPVAARGKLR